MSRNARQSINRSTLYIDFIVYLATNANIMFYLKLRFKLKCRKNLNDHSFDVKFVFYYYY